MVYFWPWKGDDSSPASFEKTLSALSVKLATKSSKLDSTRQRSRRLNVLWTLYAGFAYLLYTIILVLVVGWRNWGPVEYAAVTVGPVTIYLVRLVLSTYYEYRTSSIQGQVDEVQKQRDATIEKLKAATKYNSTQELLKKYGGTPTPKAKLTGDPDRKVTPKQGGTGTPKDSRTSFVPPPTANILGRDRSASSQTTPQHSTPQIRSPLGSQLSLAGISPALERPTSSHDPSADFAPKAFPAAPQYAHANEGPRWYDRIMDVLLGEDETLPRARMALICTSCRLVNGQAPPGTKRLEDLGKWRCSGCGAMNGEETEAKNIVASIKKQASSEAEHLEEGNEDIGISGSQELNKGISFASADDGHEIDVTQYSSASSEGEMETKESNKSDTKPLAEPITPRRRSTRPTKGKKAG